MFKKNPQFGVVIGRFHTDELTPGHISLLDHVNRKHKHMVVLVGYNDVRETPHNPLPYVLRIEMIQEMYPHAIVRPQPDSKINPDHWSQTVDTLLADICGDDEAILYGSRKSFIPLYSGGYQTEEIESAPGPSATEVRAIIGANIGGGKEYRRGYIAAILNQFAVTDPVVDVAIVSRDYKQVLLGRRGPGGALRFPGGFVDRADYSHEAAAIRERTEEVLKIVTSEPAYVASMEVESSRYGDSGYGMKTILFCVVYESGDAEAGDDLDSVEWVDLSADLADHIDPSHVPLLHTLLQYREKQKVWRLNAATPAAS